MNEPHDQPPTTFLLRCGIVAGPLFFGAALLQGALRTDYDQVRHPISSLAIGSLGWIQVLNFIVVGALIVVFAVGSRRVLNPGRGALWGPILLAGWGIGLIGAGGFESDPVSGYPLGTPDLLPETTLRGSLHDAFSLFGFVCLAAACLVLTVRFARTERRWAVYSALTAVVFAAAMQSATLAFGQDPGLVDFGGLLQRVALLTGFAWTAAVAVHLLRVGTNQD